MLQDSAIVSISCALSISERYHNIADILLFGRPVGAWHGNGRKAQWWSPILLALQDSNTGKLVAMCKCMSGRQWLCFG
jgi:hypothetical protein